MKTINFRRDSGGNFVAENYTVEAPYWYTLSRIPIKPKLCGAATTRLFKLKPGSKRVKAVFTRTRPKGDHHRVYEIVKTWGGIKLVGFNGSFMEGTNQALIEQQGRSYRFVRMEVRA